MKAAVVCGKDDIRIQEVPTPEPGAGEVLVKVGGSGVCATDVKILGGQGLPKELPTILGHEVAGTIEAIGEGLGGYSPGRRVAVYPIAACGKCRFCAMGRHSLCIDQYGLAHGVDGGFAEFVNVPAAIVSLGGLRDIGTMPFDLAAMIEPVSCCVSAARQCGLQPGWTVAVIGCGPLGLLHLIVCRLFGARVIAIERNGQRCAAARDLGAAAVLNPETVDVRDEIRNLTGIGADVVIAAVGIPRVVEESFPLVRKGGFFNIFGGTPRGRTITVDPRWLHYGEITLSGTFAASLPDFIKAQELVRDHSDLVERVISERCPLESLVDAVQRVRDGAALKTIIMFD